MNEVFEKIIEKLEKEKNKDRIGVYSEIQCDAIKFAYGSAKEIVQEVAEEYATDTNVGNNGWIPVEERMPEENIEVLVSISEIDGSIYTGTSWVQDGVWVIKKTPLHPTVIAWQPLPEPYTKGE